MTQTQKLEFVRDGAITHGAVMQLSPLVRRIIAPNPGPFTYNGTSTFVIGRGKVAVLDPGPDDPAHLAALERALAGETVTHIVLTHTHRDHVPAALPFQTRTGARTVGRPSPPPAPDVSHTPFQPDLVLGDGDAIEGPGWHLTAVHTPGHASNHLCYAFAEEATLFTGDHVMGWSTSVIGPPDGDLTAYLASLDKVMARSETLYRSAHGPERGDGPAFAAALRAHREARSAGILAQLKAGPATISALVAALYPDLAPALVTAAGRSVLAHLIAFQRDGTVGCDGPIGSGATFFLTR
jgi:glyoxylase-like metal-dependent hydrolase (beta-lactamase superfamily II)